MTFKEARIQVAKKYGYNDWAYFLRHTLIYSDIIKAEEECMALYAESKCEEQKMICHSENKDGKSIINSPFPDFE